MSDTIPGIAPSPVSAVDLDAIEEWARGSTIMAARARIPAIVRELREAREELARLRERDAASATDDPLGSIKTMQIALRARPLDHDTLALLLVLKGAREEIERLRALLPPFVAAHNPDRAQIALLGASRPGAGLVGLAYTIDTVADRPEQAPEQVKEKTLVAWHDKPSCEGPWWFTTPDCRTPALVYVNTMWLDDGELRFAAEHFGTEDRSHEGDFVGARWTPCLTPAPSAEPVKRDPDPTAPGAPGERVERRG